jgi:hypothetical protein
LVFVGFGPVGAEAKTSHIVLKVLVEKQCWACFCCLLFILKDLNNFALGVV